MSLALAPPRWNGVLERPGNESAS